MMKKRLYVEQQRGYGWKALREAPCELGLFDDVPSGSVRYTGDGTDLLTVDELMLFAVDGQMTETPDGLSVTMMCHDQTARDIAFFADDKTKKFFVSADDVYRYGVIDYSASHVCVDHITADMYLYDDTYELNILVVGEDGQRECVIRADYTSTACEVLADLYGEDRYKKSIVLIQDPLLTAYVCRLTMHRDELMEAFEAHDELFLTMKPYHLTK